MLSGLLLFCRSVLLLRASAPKVASCARNAMRRAAVDEILGTRVIEPDIVERWY